MHFMSPLLCSTTQSWLGPCTKNPAKWVALPAVLVFARVVLIVIHAPEAPKTIKNLVVPRNQGYLKHKPVFSWFGVPLVVTTMVPSLSVFSTPADNSQFQSSVCIGYGASPRESKQSLVLLALPLYYTGQIDGWMDPLKVSRPCLECSMSLCLDAWIVESENDDKEHVPSDHS